MKVTKKMQYGMLFTLYLCRAGRATVKTVSDVLGLSPSLLAQVASTLLRKGVLTSVKGPHGGYELNDNPKVVDVLSALGSVELLTPGETSSYARGDTEYRALVNMTNGITKSMAPMLKKSIRAVSNDLIMSEMSVLDRPVGVDN